MYKRLVFIMFFILVFTTKVYAADVESNYVIGSDGNKRPIPVIYSVEKVFSNFGSGDGTMANPQDIFIDKKDNIYILDTGNNRILKLDTEGNILREYRTAGKAALNNPKGIFVDDDGDMFVADTDNKRVVHISPEGDFIEQFIQPTSGLFDTTYGFKPAKVAIDSMGQLYIINWEDYHGFIILDAFNNFKGYVAPTRLSFSITDSLVRIFATADQKEKLGKRMPPIHTNFTLGADGTIYVTTARAKAAQLQCFSSVGNNIFPKKDFFGDKQGDYVMKHFMKEFVEPEFVDVCVDDDGNVSILDNVTGRIYQYASDGTMLGAFGGTGNWRGKFMNATAMAMDSTGRIYVLDAGTGSVQCFKPTSFIKLVHNALKLYNDGKYTTAIGPWQQVLNIDRNYPVAHIGMGKAYVKQEKWAEAMKEYHEAGDKGGYSAAFEGWRKKVFRENFGIVVLIFISAVAGIIALVRYLRKLSVIIERREWLE